MALRSHGATAFIAKADTPKTAREFEEAICSTVSYAEGG
jgi:hypothetical protein